MTLSLTDTDWDDWRWGGTARDVGANAAAFAQLGASGIWVWQFTNGKELFFHDLQIPHDYKEGSTIVPHIHFCATSTTRITGVWTLEFLSWLSAASGTDIAGKTTHTATFDVNPPAVSRMVTMDFATTITGVNRTISSMAHVRLSLALTSGDALVLCGLDAHYEKDSLGSRLVGAK